ncbi:hypothetical protein SH584_06810 [Sphingomonas sp. LY29]|uniref:hypothetical protein n=1 Tax=unclassified Sphingomonas TaxID=196159 RepID=UPI002ADECCC0|nr:MULTISPECIES: hypothetical protein [unclassified Sphingomonas]MEA1072565.1 hypothetical protein [Sphingomonas sp. LY160]WRP24779.1 hypothetical protein SH584_06810 [Sphingomonas sp. LY29]
MTRTIVSLLCLGALASCSTAPAPEARSPRAVRELADALQGRVAGPPVRCLPNHRTARMEVIDDFTILYRDGRTTYVQNPVGGCRGLSNGGYTLVVRQYGIAQSCEGDINQLIDLRSGSYGGNCQFGPFIPYRNP